MARRYYDEAPSAAVARVLRQEGLVLDAAGRRAWILTPGTPPDDRPVFLANYWAVVALVLGRYAPAAVALHPGFRLRLRPRSLRPESIATLRAAGHAQVPVQTPTDLLVTLDAGDVTVGIEPVSAWLRHLVVRSPELEAAVSRSPRPVILKRLASLAAELHNEALARQLEQHIRRISHRTTSPSRTGVGTRIDVPGVLRTAARGTGSPWLDEQAMRLARQEAEVGAVVGGALDKLAKFKWELLRAQAEQNKAYDAYHSTTMEGYRITREISDTIVRGESLPAGPQDRKTLEAAMAVKGYTVAYNEVLSRVRQQAPIDTNLILDLYEALYRPSVDAGITDTAALRGWREGPVQLHGWRHVPPNAKKIPDLIGGWERFASRSELNPITRALLVHLEFVSIHSFTDGNGRLGRLLMNHALLSAGLPWVTIRSDERIPFFRSIERAQVDADTRPFIEFVWHLVQQAIKALAARSQVRRRRPLTKK